MLRGKRTRQLGRARSWAIALLLPCLALSAELLHAQSAASFLKGLLPAPQPTAPSPAPAGEVVQQEVIPLAGSPDAGEILVEEQEEGLISLKVRDASLKQVVAMIAETQRINVVFSAAEDVKITGSLIRVPWQQALESILASSGHTWTNDQGIIVVTSLIAAETIAPRAGGRHVETFELDFAKAVDVDQAVKGLLSPAGKSWVINSSVTDNRQSREVIAVVDFPGNLQQIADYICQVDQPPRQVLIKANILQIDLRDDCRSGVNIEQIIRFSGNQIDLRSVGFANPNASPAGFIQVDGGSLNSLVELLKNTTDAKSLASTELLAISGQEARLQSGQQLGFRITTTTQTSTLESVEFIDVGVVLTVTPQVTRDGRVLMRIKPEVSEGQVDPDTGLPAEDTVEVETDVLLNNGQGLVIGGLIQEIDSNVQSKLPWLGDLPYVGILFTKRQVIKSRSEIIVTLIPHVMPYAPIQIAHNDERMIRTQQPIITPPLNRAPRPYEPRLPDTFLNPTPFCPKWHYHRHAAEVATAEVPAAYPAPSTPIEVIQPDGQEGPLCYPPAGAPTPVVEQAARDYPVYR